MATPNPYPDGQDRRPRTSERVRRTMFNIVAVGALAAAPVATVSLWLLLTNPALASEVADTGSIARVLLVTIGKAIAAVLAYM